MNTSEFPTFPLYEDTLAPGDVFALVGAKLAAQEASKPKPQYVLRSVSPDNGHTIALGGEQPETVAGYFIFEGREKMHPCKTMGQVALSSEGEL